ncbi:hypothetical protein TNCV_4501141 [Trichonephila clavipes]|nr:hypothetical protein TNCV_4501141 [Trichonephila clavipes]
MGNGKFLQSLTFQDRRLESGRTKYSEKHRNDPQETLTPMIWDEGSLREPYAQRHPVTIVTLELFNRYQ